MTCLLGLGMEMAPFGSVVPAVKLTAAVNNKNVFVFIS